MNPLPHPVGHTSFWLGFAALSVAISYLLRLLASRATRAGERRIESARTALGLAAAARRERSKNLASG